MDARRKIYIDTGKANKLLLGFVTFAITMGGTIGISIYLGQL